MEFYSLKLKCGITSIVIAMQILMFQGKNVKRTVYFLCILDFLPISFLSLLSQSLGGNHNSNTSSLHSHPLLASPNLCLSAMRLLLSHHTASHSPSQHGAHDLFHWAQSSGNCSLSLVPMMFQKRNPVWNSGITFPYVMLCTSGGRQEGATV